MNLSSVLLILKVLLFFLVIYTLFWIYNIYQQDNLLKDLFFWPEFRKKNKRHKKHRKRNKNNIMEDSKSNKHDLITNDELDEESSQTENENQVSEEEKLVSEEVKPEQEEVKPEQEEVKPESEEVKPESEEVKSDEEKIKSELDEAKLELKVEPTFKKENVILCYEPDKKIESILLEFGKYELGETSLENLLKFINSH